LNKFIKIIKLSRAEATNLTIHQISFSKGATKNNIFQRTKADIFSLLLFSIFQIKSAQAETIAEYHTSVYGLELFHQIKKGFIYANINENKSIVFD